MLANAPVTAFVGAEDSPRAEAFYGGTLGLTLKSRSPFALEFDAGGTMLRVTKVATCVAAPYTVLGWNVAGIHRYIEELVAKGVVFERYAGLLQDDLGVWTSPSGARVAWFMGPDGNVLSLTEFPSSD